MLAGCASTSSKRLGNAATTPLSDINLVRDDIPLVLASARQQPYALTDELACDALVADVKALDDVLGPDLDAPENPDKPGLVERGGEEAENAAIGAVQRTAEGLIPFRSWLRKLSGAEKHSREVSASIAAGTARRAFLKGVARGKGCPVASPVAAVKPT
ncbi:hypothetical protein KSF73_00780 [Burkholderiaceae bacterium DAT-1]|nr:hypothetical protein [Burkholderiaceae bacterium DAT-1]